MSDRRPGCFKKLLVLVVTSALLVAALEVFIRVTDFWGVSYHSDVPRYFSEALVLPPEAASETGYLFRNAPDQSLDFETFRWRTDALGFRRTVDREPPRDAARKILFLGDSVTLAWGVDAQDSWIHQVEEALNADGEPRARCYNAGHLRYDTPQAAALLAAIGPGLAPDVVVLTFVTNDLESSWEIYQDLMKQASEPPEPGLSTTVDREWRRATQGIRQVWQVLEGGPKVPDDVTTAPEYAESWARVSAALDRLLDTTRSLGATLLVLDHSEPRVGALASWCQTNGVRFEPFQFTQEEWARGLANSVADQHANPLGNDLLTEKALPVLREVLESR